MQLLRASRPYLDRFEDFRASVVDNEEEIISELTQVIVTTHFIIAVYQLTLLLFLISAIVY